MAQGCMAAWSSTLTPPSPEQCRVLCSLSQHCDDNSSPYSKVLEEKLRQKGHPGDRLALKDLKTLQI